MKKLILSSALIATTGLLIVSCKDTNSKAMGSEVQTSKMQTTMSEAEKAQMASSTPTAQEDGFSEATPKDVPKVVVDALMRDFPTADISRISVNTDRIFRLDGSFGDGSKAILYADAKGNWYTKDDTGNFTKK